MTIKWIELETWPILFACSMRFSTYGGLSIFDFGVELDPKNRDFGRVFELFGTLGLFLRPHKLDRARNLDHFLRMRKGLLHLWGFAEFQLWGRARSGKP